jgi:hypothetical protein
MPDLLHESRVIVYTVPGFTRSSPLGEGIEGNRGYSGSM